MVRAAAVVLTVAAAGCGSAAPPPEPRSPSVEADPAPRAIPLDDAAVERMRRAPCVLVGRIVEVGPAPEVWSGVVATFQVVVLQVEQRLGGTDRGAAPNPGSSTRLRFGVVGPPDCDPSRPRLDSRVYRVGARGVVATTAHAAPSRLGNPTADADALTSFHELAAPEDVARLAARLLSR